MGRLVTEPGITEMSYLHFYLEFCAVYVVIMASPLAVKGIWNIAENVSLVGRTHFNQENKSFPGFMHKYSV